MSSIIEPLESRRLMASGTILFVRGADRSGGFLEATNDTQRTEQLADITNTSTSTGNHGWATLANLLRGQGYTVQQVKEPLETGAPSTGQTTGAPIQFQNLDLSQYAGIVMASNNAVYGSAQITAIDNYVRNGGGVLFISDGNFGSSWSDAPSSDNPFLANYGLAFNQDNGQYTLSRSGGDFADADNPILFGVDAFDGEGVSPVRVSSSPPEWRYGESPCRREGDDLRQFEPRFRQRQSRLVAFRRFPRCDAGDRLRRRRSRGGVLRPQHVFQRQRCRHGHHQQQQPTPGHQLVRLADRPAAAGGDGVEFRYGRAVTPYISPR
ncbi:MAG: hypothetical protein QM754_04680 [Tepidisphaeraceae bacterium]